MRLRRHIGRELSMYETSSKTQSRTLSSSRLHSARVFDKVLDEVLDSVCCGAAYPFTAPSWIPLTRYLCISTNTTISGTTLMVTPAISS